MQEKTIKSVMRRKLEDWVFHVDDEKLKELIKRDAICTGGAFVNLLLGEKVNDFDFYFKTKETTAKVAEYYLEKFKANPPSRFKNREKLVDTKVVVTEDRVKIVVQSQGLAGESGAEDYQYFEGVDDTSEPAEFVEGILKDKEEAGKKEGREKYRPVFITSNAISLSDDIQTTNLTR